MTDSMIRTLERSADPTDKHRAVRALIRSGFTQGEAWARVYGFSNEDTGERQTDSTYHRIHIDGELFHVTNVRQIGFGDLYEIETEEGDEFILSEDSETAGQAARERWQEMAEHDPEEFACMVGNETLIKWGLGQPAGPGTSKVRSLSEWLDLWLDAPEDEWARYDGNERTVERVGKLAAEMGYTPTVAYRSN